MTSPPLRLPAPAKAGSAVASNPLRPPWIAGGGGALLALGLILHNSCELGGAAGGRVAAGSTRPRGPGVSLVRRSGSTVRVYYRRATAAPAPRVAIPC